MPIPLPTWTVWTAGRTRLATRGRRTVRFVLQPAKQYSVSSGKNASEHVPDEVDTRRRELALTIVSMAESEFLTRSASHWTRPGGKSTMIVEPLAKEGAKESK